MNMRFSKAIGITQMLVVLAITGSIRQLFAQTPTVLDPTFVSDVGANDDVFTLLRQTDGKLLLGGQFFTYNGISRSKIARLESDGSLDLSFAPGAGTTNGDVYAIAIQADQKILLGGSFTSFGGHAFLTRLLPNGAQDPTFAPASINDELRAVAVQADGQILIAGRFTTVGGQPRGRVARLNSDGSLDSTFDPGIGANSSIRAMLVQPDGAILVGGQFSLFSGIVCGSLARLQSNGALDVAFAPVINNYVRAIALQNNGRIVIGGEFSSVNEQPRSHVAQLLADGSLDTSFVPPSFNGSAVRALATRPDGMVWVGGDFSTIGGLSFHRIARLTGAGTADPLFSPGTYGPNDEVFAIALQPDSKVLVGGQFDNFSPYITSVPRGRIARLMPDTTVNSFDFAYRSYFSEETYGSMPIMIHRSGATNTAASVQFSTGNGSATAGQDYAPVALRLEFLPGEATKTVGIPMLTDNDVEPSETVWLTLTNPSVNSLIGPLGAVTLLIRDRTSLVEFDRAAVAANENEFSTPLLSIRRTGWTGATASVTYHLTSGTATVGSDFTGSIISANFAIGQSLCTATVPVLNDGLVETNEEFTMSIIAATEGSVIGPQSNVVIRILDNDQPLSIGGVFHGSEHSGYASVQIRRNDDGTNTVGVGYYVSEDILSSDSALPGSDYVPIDFFEFRTLTFLPGEGIKSVFIPILKDCTAEATETFWFALHSPTGGAVIGGNDLAVVRITDDTPPRTNDLTQNATVELKHPMAVLPDGRILATKLVRISEHSSYDQLVRLHQDGTLDYAFNSTNALNSAGRFFQINALSVQSDGKVLVAGWRHLIETFGIQYCLRLNSDGSRDTNFIGTNWMSAAKQQIFGITPDRNGKVLMFGEYLLNYGGPSFIVRFNTNGTRDTSFNVSFDGTLGTLNSSYGTRVSSIGLQDDGRIVVGGSFTNVQGVARKGIARVNADGSIDPSFDPGAGVDDPVLAILPLPGSIFIGGQFSTVNGAPRRCLARLNTDGSLDQGFTPGGNLHPTVVNALMSQKSGRVLVGGGFTNSNFSGPKGGLVRLHPSGALDSWVNDPLTVTQLGLSPDDGVIAIGISGIPPGASQVFKLRRYDFEVRTEFDALTRIGPNSTRLKLSGPSGSTARIDASSDLRHWEAIGSVNFNGCPIWFEDHPSTVVNPRFYRTVRVQP